MAKLKNPNEAIPQGLWYQYSDSNGNTYRVNGMDLTFGTLFFNRVIADMQNHNVEVPENIKYLIEQQICERIGGQYCWQEAGDKVATVIHKFAHLGDFVANQFGVNAQLEQRAKGCSSCNQRRELLNQTLG